MIKQLTFVFLLISGSHAIAQRFEPVNKNATPEAKKLLSYLYDIKGKYILSGEHNYNHEMNVYSDSVRSITGKYPALWGTDFIWNGTNDPGQQIVNEAIKKWKQGYLVTLMWHQGRPIDLPPYGWKESVQGKLTDAEWQELITPGRKRMLFYPVYIPTMCNVRYYCLMRMTKAPGAPMAALANTCFG